MDFTMFGAWRTVAGAVTGSVISGRRWLLVLNTVSEVLEKHPEKLIRECRYRSIQEERVWINVRRNQWFWFSQNCLLNIFV